MADLFEQFGRKPNWYRGAEPGAVPAAGRSLGLLVLWLGVEGVLLIGCHWHGHFPPVLPVLDGKRLRCLVAADRAATARIIAARRGQRHQQYPAADLRAHQPVRRRLRRVEQRIAGPHVIDVVDSQVRMLEQVRSLGIDLERVLLIEQARSNRSSSTC